MKKNIFISIFVAISYISMVTINFLANALPIGGRTTGQASDSFGNLFTPAGVTFSIWGLIYTLLAVYVGYTILMLSKKKISKKKHTILYRVALLFIISSIANVTWIFAWHYGIIWLSVLIMLVLLISMISIANIINNSTFSKVEKFCIRLPFSIYFGWITIATIANITVFLVSINWSGWGMRESIWTVIILMVGALIGIIRAYKDKNIVYILVFVWAYSGIIFKHYLESGYNGMYPEIIIMSAICIIFFTGTIGYILYKNIHSNDKVKIIGRHKAGNVKL